MGLYDAEISAGALMLPTNALIAKLLLTFAGLLQKTVPRRYQQPSDRVGEHNRSRSCICPTGEMHES